MSKEIKTKNIIFYSVFGLITVLLLDLFFKPEININMDFIGNGLKKVTSSQNIAPQRLFINAWRIAKNSYIDETLNNQDWMRWRTRYVKHIKTMEDANVAINSMLASLNDPYTKFLQSELFSKQKMILDSKITGVGVLFNKAGDEVVVNHVLDNSSAQEENIMPGDTIVEINGTKTSELEIEDIVKTMESGEKGTVEIKIKRNNEIINKTLKRTDIPIETMECKIVDNIGLITLSNTMGDNAVEEFKQILIDTNDTKGLIIDLRNNYGGILANAVQMVNFMLSEDETIFSINSRAKANFQIYADKEKVFKDKPVIVLINNLTASAAEIMAGTLKDNLNAVLVGEHSFGKNSIQQVIPLQNATGLILTTDKYILPNGQDINKKGIVPDIEMKQKIAFSIEKDNQIQKAIEIINSVVENKEDDDII